MKQMGMMYPVVSLGHLMRNEKWKDIPCCSGFYQASCKGRIKSLTRTVVSSSGKKYVIMGKVISPYKTAEKPSFQNVADIKRQGTRRYRILTDDDADPSPEKKPFEKNCDDGGPSKK